MNQPQSEVIALKGCHSGKAVRGGWQTHPRQTKAYCFLLPTEERHELTPEEAKEGFIKGVTKHRALHFPWRLPDG